MGRVDIQEASRAFQRQAAHHQLLAFAYLESMVEASFVDLDIVVADSMDLGIVEVETILKVVAFKVVAFKVAASQLMDHTEVQLEVHRQEDHH